VKNLTGRKINLFQYQQRAINQCKGNEIVLATGPVGSGKTIIAYAFSGILDNNIERRVIFTAPIKALSNERYLELKEQGFDVGIETGDIKKDINSKILCMTQEIFSNKYTNQSNLVVVMDEIHYIFNNHDRARSYVESLKHLNPTNKLIMMSATISNLYEFADYLESLCNRKVQIVKWEERPVPLKFSSKGIKMRNVEDSIVFAFSRKDIDKIVESLILERGFLSDRINIKDIKEVSHHYKVEPLEEWFHGISRYHGMLLPKEKHCIEHLYREGYLDTIVGTDALSLGVNLPARTTIFGQLEKTTGILTPSEFYQMAGRAGRYGCHDEGLCTFLKNSPVINYDIDNGSVFKKLMESELEKSTVEIETDVKAMLNGRYLEDEIQCMCEFKFPRIELNSSLVNYYEQKIKNDMKIVEEYQEDLHCRKGLHYSNDWMNLLKQCYLPEYEIEFNCKITEKCLSMMCSNGCIDAIDLKDFATIESSCPGEELHDMLLLRKFLIGLDQLDIYRLDGFDKLICDINELDHTVLNI